MTDPHLPTSTVEEGSSGGWRRAAVALAVASFVGIWGYVLYLSVFPGRTEPRDRLDDTAWTASAEATCADVARELSRLPYANEVSSPAERAALLDAATDRLEVMVRRLEDQAVPSDADEASAVRRWLDDWRTYDVDRREYADRLRSGEDAPFSVTRRGRYHLDLLIDDFATVNHMDSCTTPDDVG